MDCKFVWWPVRLFRYERPYWCPTGKWAWLRRVGVTHTVWRETFYTELPQTDKDPN